MSSQRTTLGQAQKVCFVIHSKCCRRHWEFGINHDGELVMVCEKCGTGIGPQTKLSSGVLAAKFNLGDLKRPLKGTFSALHTRCCGTHWEIVVYQDKTAALVCAKCGSREDDVKVELINLPMKCSVCGKGACDHDRK